MKICNEASKNPLKTRDDFALALTQILEPLKPFYSKGRARLELEDGYTAHYPIGVAELEGFSRVLWGVAPLLHGGFKSDFEEICLCGLKNGTNPEHEEYWGDIGDFDQRMVECAAISLLLLLCPEKFWAPLSDAEKSRLSSWLFQINNHKIHECNWLLFDVMVNMALKKIGAEYDQKRMEECLDSVEGYYLSNGWYSDGKGAHCDYYTSFAIHYYQLLYSKFMAEDDPERSKLYKARACEFAKEFIYWFSDGGSALPYGRSLTYRFAQCAFWGALAFAEVEAFPLGVIKGIVLRNLRWWLEKPIFSRDGILTIGYAYSNPFMSEDYNSFTSPYWGLKAFLPLALPASHPFWQAKEEPLPSLEKSHLQKESRFIIERNGGEVFAFTSGYEFTNWHMHCVPKYEKFVYSTLFGFSVPRQPYFLPHGAYDCTLALSRDDGVSFSVKRFNEKSEITSDRITMFWKAWDGTEVKTTIIPGAPWHIRIHEISTENEILAFDGGFAFPIEGKNYWGGFEKLESQNSAFIKSKLSSGVLLLWGDGEAQTVFPTPNTNLLYHKTAIPTAKFKVPAGKSIIAAAFYGGEAGCENEIPFATTENGMLKIFAGGKEVFSGKI